MNLGNLRGILHEGVDAWIDSVEEPEAKRKLLPLLRRPGRHARPRSRRAGSRVIIEAVVENYGEYIDYNSITTQSDRGDMLYTLLDFLRLRANYDRVAWNLRPVVLIHEVLVRGGKDRAAESWRHAVAERTADVAEELLRDYQKLCKKYGMRLPSIAERLDEQFTKPLMVDQLVALVKPAMDEIRENRPLKTFPLLGKARRSFHARRSPARATKRPNGSPRWKTKPRRCKRRSSKKKIPIPTSPCPKCGSRSKRRRSRSSGCGGAAACRTGFQPVAAIHLVPTLRRQKS